MSHFHATPAEAFGAPPGQGGPEAGAQDLLAAICMQLGSSPEDSRDIAASGCLRFDDIDFVLHVNEATQHLELYGDCGLPPPCDEAVLHRELLEEALANEIPALSLGVHPHSRRVIVKGSLCLPNADADGALGTCVLLLAAAWARGLRERFNLQSAAEGFP